MKEVSEEADIISVKDEFDDPRAMLTQAAYEALVEWFRTMSLPTEVSLDVLASMLGRVMFHIEHKEKVSVRKRTFSGINRLIDAYHLDVAPPKGSA